MFATTKIITPNPGHAHVCLTNVCHTNVSHTQTHATQMFRTLNVFHTKCLSRSMLGVREISQAEHA